MGIPPAGGRDGGGGTTGGGELRLPPPEHGSTVYCNHDYYGPVSGGGEKSGDKGVQVVARTGQGRCGGDAGMGLGGGTDGWRRRRRTGRMRRQNKSGEDNVEDVTLSTKSNYPLTYGTRLEHHRPIISTFGEPGGRIERERDTYIPKI